MSLFNTNDELLGAPMLDVMSIPPPKPQAEFERPWRDANEAAQRPWRQEMDPPTVPHMSAVGAAATGTPMLEGVGDDTEGVAIDMVGAQPAHVVPQAPDPLEPALAVGAAFTPTDGELTGVAGMDGMGGMGGMDDGYGTMTDVALAPRPSQMDLVRSAKSSIPIEMPYR